MSCVQWQILPYHTAIHYSTTTKYDTVPKSISTWLQEKKSGGEGNGRL